MRCGRACRGCEVHGLGGGCDASDVGGGYDVDVGEGEGNGEVGVVRGL